MLFFIWITLFLYIVKCRFVSFNIIFRVFAKRLVENWWKLTIIGNFGHYREWQGIEVRETILHIQGDGNYLCMVVFICFKIIRHLVIMYQDLIAGEWLNKFQSPGILLKVTFMCIFVDKTTGKKTKNSRHPLNMVLNSLNVLIPIVKHSNRQPFPNWSSCKFR